MRCTADRFRDDDLTKFICDRALYYVLEKAELQDLKPEKVRELTIRTKDAFEKSANTGEPGELLLFLFLEADGIVQLYSKMRLKTSGNISFQGYDAVHIKADDKIAFHFGHSKLFANFTQGVNAALGDIKNYFLNSSHYDLELRLISRYIDATKFGKYTNTIRALCNPYYQHKEKYREVNAVFIGSNWEFLKDGAKKGSQTLDNYMKASYEAQHSEIASQIRERVAAIDEIKNLPFVFYVLPFLSVADFREKFLKELKR